MRPKLLTPSSIADCWHSLRQQRPLVHVVPNLVTANDLANALLAVGASPIMAIEPAEFSQLHNRALVLSMGTPTIDRMQLLAQAGRAAQAKNLPIVLDPVGSGATAWRKQAALELIATVQPTILRLNLGEALALLDQTGVAHGVDVGHDWHDPSLVAGQLARRYGCVVGLTGVIDAVSDGMNWIQLEHGHQWLSQITGAGCIVTSLIGALAAVTNDALLATVSALAGFGMAAEVAAMHALGPASFRVALFDQLGAIAELIDNSRLNYRMEQHDAD